MPVCGDHLAEANNGPARRKGGLLRCRAVPRFSSPGEHEQHNPKASPWFPSKQYRNAAREHDHARDENDPGGGHEDHEHASLERGGPHPRNRASKSARVSELTPQARAAAIAAVISIRPRPESGGASPARAAAGPPEGPRTQSRNHPRHPPSKPSVTLAQNIAL